MEVAAKNGKLFTDIVQTSLVSHPGVRHSRAQVLFCAMVSGYDSVHVRANIPRLEEAIKYGSSAGDR